MTNLLNSLDPALRAGALEIVERLRASGHVAYFAGGVVRDSLLGRPVSDIDIATSATPETVERLFDKTIPVGRQFGVVIVVVGTHSYEVTTFRSEGEYLDGRHPSHVVFSDARQDANRRDFTVNALFFDPASGEVLDYVRGRQDLKEGLLRTVGAAEARFEEDKLRVIRAIRFACRLDFRIEDSTWEAVCRFAGRLGQVSWERVRDELLKILTGPNADRGMRLMLDSGILARILPEVAAMDGVAQPPEFHPEGDVFVHTCLMLSKTERPSPTLAMAALLHDVGKPPTFTVRERIRFDGHDAVGAEMSERICRRLRLSNEQTENIVDLVRCHLRFMHVFEMRESTLKRFLRKENILDHLELHRLDCLSSHQDLRAYHFCLAKLEEFSREQISPPPLLTGHDLIAAGLTPGPVFGQILSELEDLQLEGAMVSREAALEWLGERLKSL